MTTSINAKLNKFKFQTNIEIYRVTVHLIFNII